MLKVFKFNNQKSLNALKIFLDKESQFKKIKPL